MAKPFTIVTCVCRYRVTNDRVMCTDRDSEPWRSRLVTVLFWALEVVVTWASPQQQSMLCWYGHTLYALSCYCRLYLCVDLVDAAFAFMRV